MREDTGRVSGPHDHDDPVSLGLSTDTIDGGLYAYERLRGDHESLIARIASTFEALGERYSVDPATALHRVLSARSDEFVLYLPVTG